MGCFVSPVLREYSGAGFPRLMRVCQSLSPAQGEAGGEGLACVSSPPFMFFIPQGPLVTMATSLQVAKFKTIYFQARSFADIIHPDEKTMKTFGSSLVPVLS